MLSVRDSLVLYLLLDYLDPITAIYLYKTSKSLISLNDVARVILNMDKKEINCAFDFKRLYCSNYDDELCSEILRIITERKTREKSLLYSSTSICDMFCWIGYSKCFKEMLQYIKSEHIYFPEKKNVLNYCLEISISNKYLASIVVCLDNGAILSRQQTAIIYDTLEDVDVLYLVYYHKLDVSMTYRYFAIHKRWNEYINLKQNGFVVPNPFDKLTFSIEQLPLPILVTGY